MGGLAFRRRNRLLRPAEFAEVFDTRRVLRGLLFALHLRAHARPLARLGLVIPRKRAAAAVLRNAIKRQAREAFRQRRDRLEGFDLVLRLVRPVGAPDKGGWRTEICTLFDRVERG
ncbi:MAG: ribonuclease P protein component [Sulfuritalea sp.]|nr:ribonuclease P protein component [Sulfuritalea sp.]